MLKRNSVSLKKFCLFAFLFALLLLDLHPAFAARNVQYIAEQNGIAEILCKGVRFIQSGVGKAIAALVVFSIGLGTFLGKFSWGVLVSTVLGIGAMFGGEAVISALSKSDKGSGGCNCKTSVKVNPYQKDAANPTRFIIRPSQITGLDKDCNEVKVATPSTSTSTS